MRTIGKRADNRWEVVEENAKGEIVAAAFFDNENRARAYKRCMELEDAGVPTPDAVARSKREYPFEVGNVG